MSDAHSDVFIGISKEEIDTPALLIDLDIFEANLRTMADFFKTVNAELRPACKNAQDSDYRAQAARGWGNRHHLRQTWRG